MIDLNALTVREIALAAPETTRVFQEYKIDFCCGGRKSLSEACLNAGVSADDVSAKLKTMLDIPTSIDHPERFAIPDLVNHIIDKHHEFTRSQMLRLGGLMEKVAWKHGEAHPELHELKEKLTELTDDLVMHMRKEEMILFPYIQDLVRSSGLGGLPPAPPFVTVSNPVRVMQYEHDAAGDILKKMRELSGDYRAPAGACPSFTALYFGLDALEKDLHQHIHLENNVLFPQAEQLEQKLFAVD
jgi:regulator of cell morphogenesis and NO signaling